MSLKLIYMCIVAVKLNEPASRHMNVMYMLCKG